MIYLDNAATTLIKPDCVIEAVCGAMSHMGNSGRGSHGASLDAARTIYEAQPAFLDLKIPPAWCLLPI